MLCEGGAVGGVDVRGSSPGTRETDLLRPTYAVDRVHAILLSGGSLFGLDAASGVVRYLEERGVGIKFGKSRLPIVSAAILFDLGVVTDKVRPGPQEGYLACRNAGAAAAAQGTVGAGTGATVAKIAGLQHSVKGGIGTASLDLGEGLSVGAIVAVNALGGVFEPDTGALLAGVRTEAGAAMRSPLEMLTSAAHAPGRPATDNTTIGVVATNARLNKEQANKVASVAHDGLALSVRPAHLTGDGDTMFAMATGALELAVDLDRVLAASAVCVGRAIVRGVREADGIGGIPSIKELAGHEAS